MFKKSKKKSFNTKDFITRNKTEKEEGIKTEEEKQPKGLYFGEDFIQIKEVTELVDISDKKDEKNKSEPKVKELTVEELSSLEKKETTKVTKKHISPGIREILYKKVSLTFLLLEDNVELNEISSKLKPLVSKIIIGKDRIICPIKYGKDVQEFDEIINTTDKAAKTDNKEFLEDYISFRSKPDDIDLSKAIYYIWGGMEKIPSSKLLEIENEKFKIESINIVVIGTGKVSSDEFIKESLIEQLAYLEKTYNIKTKYFCINDIQSIDVASIGFNIIGHINTDFYS